MTDTRTIGETDLQEVIDHPMGGKKNIILDSQVLSTLMGCGRLTDFRFNHNLKSINGKSNSLEVGSLVHVALEYYYKNIIAGVKKSDAVQLGLTAAEMYVRGCPACTDFTPTTELPKPACGHKADEFPGMQNTPPDNSTQPSRIGWRWAIETVEQYFKFNENDHWVPLEVEIVKGEVLYEDDEIRILWKAKLDLVSDTNQGIYPIDHKTMKQRRDQIKQNVQFMGQCLIQKTRSVIINKIGFQTTLEPKEKFVRSMINYSADALLEFQGEILPYYAYNLIQYAETGYWPPNFDHCETKYGKCAFLSVCESDRGMREDEIKRLFFVGPEWNPTNEDDVVSEE